MIYALFLVRLVWISFVRFLVMQGLMQFYNNFEVSPLPDWTLTIFLYLLYIVVAAIFAVWLWRNRLPKTWQLIATMIGFVLLQSFFELVTFKLFTFGTWQDISRLYTWSTFFVPFFSVGALFVMGVAAGWWYLRRRSLRAAQSNDIRE